ncbi:MAG: nicotinate phosphoribosyltransferase [Nitrospinae bacterium]|nr:nicotinate phosphoribosyltransferase [Nitrospinota bacterium]
MTAPSTGLFTDLYQLTMAQGYRQYGLHEREACFDLFFRYNPFGGGYSVSAGLADALAFLENMRFSPHDLAYLESCGLFTNDFLASLESFRFAGDVYAVPEGTVMFPLAPLLRVQGPLDHCQMVESALLNIVNFQSLIATKSARICQEAGGGSVVEFGMRRAQGPDGALTAARAAHIGGCTATSNVLAGKTCGIPVSGTHAHSWVLAFESELESFRAYAKAYPRTSVLLVDTYDTLNSGVPNAITVGKEMLARGEHLLGIRLDSGDLAYLSAQARKMLDEAGLPFVKIVCSGELDEFIIHDLKIQGAKIDIYGVGQNLVTAKGNSSFPGVFKLSAVRRADGQWHGRMKLSDSAVKATIPGLKQVWRLTGADGGMMADIIELVGTEHEFAKGVWGYHPVLEYEKKYYEGIASAEPLLQQVMKGGKRCADLPPLSAIRERLPKGLAALHATMRRLLNPHVYKVSLGEKLMEETARLRRAI